MWLKVQGQDLKIWTQGPKKVLLEQDTFETKSPCHVCSHEVHIQNTFTGFLWARNDKRQKVGVVIWPNSQKWEACHSLKQTNNLLLTEVNIQDESHEIQRGQDVWMTTRRFPLRCSV